MTMFTRRNLLLGLLAAPAIIKTPGLLMPIKALDEEPPILAWPSPINFSSIYFADGQAYLVRGDGTVLISHDGGVNWELSPGRA